MAWLWLWLAVAFGFPDRGFSEGTQPIDIGAPFLPAQTCAECHPTITQDWSTSRHAAAHTNPLYRWGLAAEPAPFCLNCHSPQPEQVAEALTELPTGPGGTVVDRSTPLADEGVSCVACHMREGRILAPRGSPGEHPQDTASDLRDPAFCAGCHEFRIPRFVDGQLELSNDPIQSTYSEWLDYRNGGGEGTCQSCHMPAGKHLFHGANDRPTLASSPDVEAQRVGDRVHFTLTSVSVGHHLPSGDLFRHMTLEVRGQAQWSVVARFGREFEHGLDPMSTVAHKTLSRDTSLRPGEARSFEVDAKGPLQWRVVYHYGSEFDERRSGLPDAVLYATMATGQVY